jgi:hypothetical protein
MLLQPHHLLLLLLLLLLPPPLPDQLTNANFQICY